MQSKESNRLLTIGEVIALVKRSKASVYADIAAGRFPAQIAVGCSSRWIESEIAAFIQRCIDDSRAGVTKTRAAPIYSRTTSSADC